MGKPVIFGEKYFTIGLADIYFYSMYNFCGAMTAAMGVFR